VHHEKKEKDTLLEAVTFSKIRKIKHNNNSSIPSFYAEKRPLILGLLRAGAEYTKEGKDPFIYSALANNDLEVINYLQDLR
jgi:hypothetical protein